MSKVICGVLAFFLFIGVIGFGGSYLNWWGYNYFAPKYESTRRDVMIQSRAYSEATVRALYEYKLQWNRAKDPNEKAIIKAAALHEFEIFDKDRLPPDLLTWLNQLEEDN